MQVCQRICVSYIISKIMLFIKTITQVTTNLGTICPLFLCSYNKENIVSLLWFIVDTNKSVYTHPLSMYLSWKLTHALWVVSRPFVYTFVEVGGESNLLFEHCIYGDENRTFWLLTIILNCVYRAGDDLNYMWTVIVLLLMFITGCLYATLLFPSVHVVDVVREWRQREQTWQITLPALFGRRDVTDIWNRWCGLYPDGYTPVPSA